MNQKIIIIITIVIVVSLIVFGILCMKYKKDTEVISSQIEEAIVSLSLSKEINTDIVSTVEYSLLEKVVKSEINNTYKSIQEYKEVMTKINVGDMLRPENIKKDTPKFVNSKTNIEKAIKITTDIKNMIVKLSDRDKMTDVFNSNGIEEKKQKIYFRTVDNKKIEENIKEMETRYNKKIAIYTSMQKVINFLANNQNDWYISGDNISIKTQDKLVEYNKLIEELSNLAS